MQRIVMSVEFRGEAAEPSGEPPQTDPRATSVAIETEAADRSPVGIETASPSTGQFEERQVAVVFVP
jgi:hypothetical protein